MFRASLLLLALAAASTSARAQDSTFAACARPDTVVIRGNARVSDAAIRAGAGVVAGDTLDYRTVQRVIQSLYGSGQFSDVRVACVPSTRAGRTALLLQVRERPVLGSVQVSGMSVVPERLATDKVDLAPGQPLDPAQVARVIARIDSLYAARGYSVARVQIDSTAAAGRVNLAFRVTEGPRLAIAGVAIEGNRALSDATVAGAMKTKPEGFWWFRRGRLDEAKLAADVGERIPQLYASRGFIDFQVARDTVIVDRAQGKALVRINVDEGPRYRVGTFEVVGNRRFPSEVIEQFYPFSGGNAPSLTERLKGLVGRGPENTNAFDQKAWDAATDRLRTAYANEGYIYAQVRPVVERTTSGPDSVPAVNLRWEIAEGAPAIVNRVEIVGNDYTSSACIRDQIFVLPGDVFSQDRLIRSYQNISNLGFFEQPLPPPDTRPANDKGDVDIIFRVKEKRTGNVNFGGSLGQGTGLGGFIGVDQPNLFGNCKRISLQWQFGRYLNDFTLSYTDPAIRLSRISGTVTAYNTRTRYIVADLGRQTSTGGSLQFGFPVPGSRFTRLFASYGGQAVKYTQGLAARDTTLGVGYNFRSTLGLTATRDTRIGLPFATAGALQTVVAELNGGPLGGTSDYQRVTGEMRAYTPLATLGDPSPGSAPITVVLGFTGRMGAVFGNVGPFFPTQKFALGGTQYGEMLRGYDEFQITPAGVMPNGGNGNAQSSSFGSAFLRTTTEVGVRFNQMIYANVFLDAGNVWNRPREFDPTRLYRGAGVGVALVTPLGPLGLDWAYGFDRVDQFGNPAPKWQLHFRLGNLF